MRRRWSINGRFLTQKITGVQRYAREIVSAMDMLAADGHPLARELDLTLLVPGSYQGPLPAYETIRIQTVGRLRGHAWEQIELPVHARGGILSLCNTGPLLRRKQVVCIHDLNPFLFPSSYSWLFRTGYGAVVPVLGRTAAGLATVSRFSAQLLVEHGIARGRTPTIAVNGHEHVRRWSPPGAMPARSHASTVLLLGSQARHKNISIVLGLVPRLAARGIDVAVVGGRTPRVFGQFALPPEQQTGIRWLGAVSDDDLASVMQTSLCLAFPSLMEGFGLPPLEAMALGCPVVASKCASLPEVCGDAALYASPTDPEEWLSRLVTLHEDPRLRQTLIAKGRAKAESFSWARSAEIYLNALAEVDGVPAEHRATVSPTRVPLCVAGPGLSPDQDCASPPAGAPSHL
jgi:glycosyltransferase involved in cell wall biosynthesis